VNTEKLPKIEAKKSLGQHFLNNSRVPELMADAGNVQKGDIVLEIGPGTGVLTRELLKRGAYVVAVEADIRAIESLRETFSKEIIAQNIDLHRQGLCKSGGLMLIHGDVREIDLNALGLRPSAFKIVANIPYYLSGMLFRTFLESDIQPTDLIFLVQKEVALRIARDKKESLLSLSIKVFGDPLYIKTIGKGNFTPPPKIDSAIIAISDISNKKLDDAGVSREQFFKILHQGLKSKRKQLLGNLSGILPRETLTHIFSTFNLPLDVRGEDVPLEKWLTLCKEISVHM
jgi:16S rRNA (adenine1518-N6/adenine1519-N6)-dimethyltransferase